MSEARILVLDFVGVQEDSARLPQAQYLARESGRLGKISERMWGKGRRRAEDVRAIRGNSPSVRAARPLSSGSPAPAR